MDCSLPGCSFHGNSPAQILEWVVMPFSRGSSQTRDWTQVSCIAGGFFIIWATREALLINPLNHSNPRGIQILVHCRCSNLRFRQMNDMARNWSSGDSHSGLSGNTAMLLISALLLPGAWRSCTTVLFKLWYSVVLRKSLRFYQALRCCHYCSPLDSTLCSKTYHI